MFYNRNNGEYQRITSLSWVCAKSYTTHTHSKMHTQPLGYGKRFGGQLPNFVACRESWSQVCFDWWSEPITSHACVWARDTIDFLNSPRHHTHTHLSLCWHITDDLNREGGLSGIEYHILGALLSVPITLCRLLPYSMYSIIKMNQIHSRCVAACLVIHESLIIFCLHFLCLPELDIYFWTWSTSFAACF